MVRRPYAPEERARVQSSTTSSCSDHAFGSFSVRRPADLLGLAGRLSSGHPCPLLRGRRRGRHRCLPARPHQTPPTSPRPRLSRTSETDDRAGSPIGPKQRARGDPRFPRTPKNKAKPVRRPAPNRPGVLTRFERDALAVAALQDEVRRRQGDVAGQHDEHVGGVGSAPALTMTTVLPPEWKKPTWPAVRPSSPRRRR